MNSELIEHLTKKKKTAISTISSIDLKSASDLKIEEFFLWMVGPKLDAGDIVALYVPKVAKHLDYDDRGKIKYIFSVARKTYPTSGEFRWNNVVFLHNRVTLRNPLTIAQLKSHEVTKVWPLPRSNFRNVGRLKAPLSALESQLFWELVLNQNQSILEKFKLLIDSNPIPNDALYNPSINPEDYQIDFAISVAGEDKPLGEMIADALEKDGYRVFLYETKYDQWATPRKGVDVFDKLQEIYQKKALFIVPILSENFKKKGWTKREIAYSLARPYAEAFEYILPICLDDSKIPGIQGKYPILLNLKDVIKNISNSIKKLGT